MASRSPITKLVSTEDREQAERELQQLVDAVPQHIVVLSGDGRRLYANQAARDYHSLTLDQFLVEPITNCFHRDDIENYNRIRDSGIARGEPWEAEARLRRKDGAYRWFLIRAKPLRNEQGLVMRWYLTRTDIEDRKQAERELRQMVDAIPQHVVVLAADGRALYVNKVAVDFYGYTPEECLDAAKLKEKVHPEDFASYLNTRQRGISIGLPFQTEVRLRSRSGEYRWFLVLFNPLKGDQGQVLRWYATATDIEDRKRVERELQRETETLAIFQKLVQSSMEGILAFDSVGRYTVWNPALERIFGISELQRLGKQASDLCPFFHLTGGVNCYREALAGKGVLATDIPYVFAETGKEIFLDARFSPLMDEGGNIIGGLAIIRDITERKRAEDALHRKEAYLAEAQRLSHTGSFAHDPLTGEITYLSSETYRIFGFDPAKGLISFKEARSRVHAEDLQRFDEARERGIREKTGAKIDFRIVLPDGSIKHIHCVSHPFLNASGEVVELVGTNMDVTEQHQARAALEKAFEEIKQLKDELYRENLALKDEIDQASMFEEIVGTSEVLRRVLVQVAKVARTDSTVLISGETGTGKELIARAIHKRSQRSSKTFVSVNCAAIPAGLIGSELFGHEKGAFTGATQRRLGRFELADGGTLFLDEVGDLPPETQIALLRVLQERQLERVGGTQSITVDVRIIAATNRDLKSVVSSGAFRSDLFYRLNVFPITVPPLRDRKDDIPLLVEYLTERYASKAGKKIKNIHKRTLGLFQAYDWPGNIRELQNVIERAVILCEGQTLSVDESWLQPEPPGAIRASHTGNGLARMGPDRERELIESALAESHGRIAGPSGAAAKLGIPRSTLETKIRKLGIKKHGFLSV